MLDVLTFILAAMAVIVALQYLADRTGLPAAALLTVAGLVYGVLLDGPDRATLDMTLTSAACPLTDEIEAQAAEALKDTLTDFTLNWVWMPPWGPESITEDGREQLRALGFNI